MQVVERVAHVFGFDFVLVVVRVHADVHRVCKVRVCAIFFVQNDLVNLVVGLEDVFCAEAANQAFELHAHGGRVTAAAAVFGFQHDHRVLAVHDDVSGADFLSDFHKNVKLGPQRALLE